MLPINPTLKLVIALILVGGIGALKAIAPLEPAWTWIGTVVQIAMAAELYFTVPPMSVAKANAAASAAIARQS